MSLLKRPEKGKYVTFEGLEGVGKSYLLEKLKEEFVVISDESLDGIGLKLIEALRNKDTFFRHGYPLSEFLVFFAAELYEIEKKVIPALKKGKIVIQDRGIDTNVLYAALQMKIDMMELFRVREKMCFLPDITILFIDDFMSCMKRAEQRNGREYTSEELAFLGKIQKGFEEIQELFPERIKRINRKGKSEKDVLDEVRSFII